MFIDPIIIPIILAFFTIVPSVLVFFSTRSTNAAIAKLQPSQIRAVETAAAQDAAETDTISIANSRDIYGAYKELLADVSDMMRKQVKTDARLALVEEQNMQLQSRLKTVEDENTSLKSQLAIALEKLSQALAKGVTDEAKYLALDERTRDYPHRLELAELEISSLKATIEQKDVAAAQTSQTANTEAMTRKTVADAALLAAGGTPMPESVAPESETSRPLQSGDNVIVTAVDHPPENEGK